MITRRMLVNSMLGGGAALALGAPSARFAAAQTVDSLKLFVPAAPGGGWDQTARTMEQVLKAANIVQNIQLEHVPGAGGTVGLPRFVNQMRGQANTLMVAGMVMVGAIATNKTPVNLAQTTPIARLTGEYEAIVVPAQSDIKSMADLVAKLKANVGGVSWAGGSAGGTDHILVGMIGQAVGVDPKRMSYVAFAGGGEAQAAILGNQVTCGVSGWGEFAEQVKAGRFRAIAISSDKRVPGIDVPTLKEQGVDVELANWRGVFAPPGVSPAARTAMLGLVDRMAKSPQWVAEAEKRSWIPIYLAGEDYAKYVAAETTRIEGILKGLGLAG